MSELGQKLIEIVRRKATENPAHIYPRPRSINGELTNCEYVGSDGAPGCLIGQALFEAGVIDGGFYSSDKNISPFTTLTHELLLGLDQEEVNYLASVQSWQDEGYPWGHCLTRVNARERGWSW